MSQELELSLGDAARVADLRALLAGRYPLLEKLGDRIATSVNLELVGDDHVLGDGDGVPACGQEDG